MRRISIVAVGNLKEKYFIQAVDEYVKRLSPFCKIDIVEVKEAVARDEIEGLKASETEAASILKRIEGSVVAMDMRGVEMDSLEFSDFVTGTCDRGPLTFVIGGSYGLHQSVIKRADKVISLGKMTLPHRLARLVLVEQVYRAFMIASSRSYHK